MTTCDVIVTLVFFKLRFLVLFQKVTFSLCKDTNKPQQYKNNHNVNKYIIQTLYNIICTCGPFFYGTNNDQVTHSAIILRLKKSRVSRVTVKIKPFFSTTRNVYCKHIIYNVINYLSLFFPYLYLFLFECSAPYK